MTHLRSRLPLFAAVAALAWTLAQPAPAEAASVADPGLGPFNFKAGSWELSGLAHVTGNQYYGVGDTGALLVPLTIGVNTATGAVTGVSSTAPVVLAGGVDVEGVAWDSATGTVLVSDETGPAIRRHDPTSGALLGTVAVPSVFGNARANRSLESLSRNAASGAIWTANEDALVPDGPVTTFAAGSVVRLQRFDSAGAPNGQWAYLTDAIPGDAVGGLETSGVTDLLALPSGELLVLERSLSSLFFQVRIYQVDLTGATDTSVLSGLIGAPYTPVAKTLLWTSGEAGQFANFEGLSLGPQLDDGSMSLLLVADDNATKNQALYPLRLSFVPEPGTATLLAPAVAGLAVARRWKRRSVRA